MPQIIDFLIQCTNDKGGPIGIALPDEAKIKTTQILQEFIDKINEESEENEKKLQYDNLLSSNKDFVAYRLRINKYFYVLKNMPNSQPKIITYYCKHWKSKVDDPMTQLIKKNVRQTQVIVRIIRYLVDSRINLIGEEHVEQ